jgi:hypothetical protein
VLPRLVGDPIRVEIRRSLGSHLAGASIPRRLILLDAAVLSRRSEFERILIHELFHFAWVRLSNQKRVAWEQVLAAELRGQVKGELGWSAESRKEVLTRADPRLRTPKWRRYACESFCDSAAWIFAGLPAHDEFTLAAAARRLRRRWFTEQFPASRPVAV